jgi:uncharacterized BrkB/YihY/UPF0761 family membrane protein
MDSFGIFFTICILAEIIVLNILFSKKIKNRKLKVKKINLFYFVISLVSFLFIFIIVNLFYELLQKHLLNNLIQSDISVRLIIMNLILILLPLLQLLISQIFINLIDKKNKINEITLIGQNEE